MIISRAWLQKYFDTELPAAEQIAELFTFHAFEVEDIKMSGADTMIDLKVLPDRAHYALCHRGIARELSAIGNFSLKKIEEKNVPVSEVPELQIVVDDSHFCRRYVGRRVENVTVTDSPEWLKTAIESIGGRSINSVVDATNYVMFDVGQPLHAFDADKIVGAIRVRYAFSGEKIVTLDNKDITLSVDDSVIADDNGPLAIAGVKGGNRAEVTKETKRIVVESANFDPVLVRRTTVRVGIKNDASRRYENEITPYLAGEAMDAVSAIIATLSPKASMGKIVDMYPAPVTRRCFSVDTNLIRGTLGCEIDDATIIKILVSLDIGVEANGKELSLAIPYDRLDLTIPEDIAEEVGRMFGYDKVVGVLPPQPKEKPAINKSFYVSEKIKNVLVSLGFSEVYLYSLVAKGDFEVTYPLASDKSFLRTNLRDGVVKSLEMNVRNADILGKERVKIFEIGKVFPLAGEALHFSIGIAEVKKNKKEKPEESIAVLLKKLSEVCGIEFTGTVEKAQNSAWVELSLEPFIQGVTADSYDDLGFIRSPAIMYKKFSPYPFIVRDIAVFVQPHVTEDALMAIIREEGTSLIVRGPELFDVFEKKNEAGVVEKKSLAFRMVFQSFEKTLTDEEVNPIIKRITERFMSCGYEVR
jgi:phenylalanyl-tRNA synthetase beta chain